MNSTSKTYAYSDSFCVGVCDNHSTATAEIGFEIDGKSTVKVVPTPKGEMASRQHIILDAHNLESKGFDLDKYSYVTIEYKYVSKKPLEKVKMGFHILSTKLAIKNPVLTYSYDYISEGSWNVACFNIGKALKDSFKEGNHILSQLHIFPFGSAKPSAMSEDDVLYIGNITFTTENPNCDRVYLVSFSGGGANGVAPETIKAKEDESVVLPECTFAMEGYEFDGWWHPMSDHMTSGYVTASDINHIFNPGDKITVENDDMEFFAKWKVPANNNKPTIVHTPYDEILVKYDGKEKMTLDALSEMRKAEILSTPDKLEISGTKYYVSAEGNDDNDGMSPEKAWKTIYKASTAELRSGDGVLFRRGDMFRGNLKTVAGVSYGAYGSGAKPILSGSEENGAGAEKWALVEGTTNLWKYCTKMCDIGGLVVKKDGVDGEYLLEKECANVDFSDVTYYKRGLDGDKFNPLTDIRNMWFFCMMDTLDFRRDRYDLVLRCDDGNPGEIFDSIEFIDGKGHVIRAVSNVTIDNLCILHGGCHGIGAGTVKNLVVTNCEIGWIGGSLFGVWRDANTPSFVRFGRYGNGVEVYGGCDGFVIDNCYVYQCFDAGITNQYQKGGGDNIVEKDVAFTNNLIEYCCYNIEYFMGIGATSGVERFLQNVLYENNILRAAGFGWGRPNPTNAAAIKGWDHFNKSENFVIKNNIFDRSYGTLLHIGTQQTGWMPKMEGNVYIQHQNSMLGTLGATPTTKYVYDADTCHTIKNVLGESPDEVYFLEERK